METRRDERAVERPDGDEDDGPPPSFFVTVDEPEPALDVARVMAAARELTGPRGRAGGRAGAAERVAAAVDPAAHVSDTRGRARC